MDYSNFISALAQIPLWFLLLVLFWDAIWKIASMWKAAKKNSPIWFVVLAIVNSVGILPILYIYVFSEMGKKKSPTTKPVRAKAKPKRKKR